MRILVLSCAEAELAGAVDFYNTQRPGLGFEFAAEVKAAFRRVQEFPTAWPAFSERSRRCMVNRFPFGVLYQARADVVLVIAIMDLRRDPLVWAARG